MTYRRSAVCAAADAARPSKIAIVNSVRITSPLSIGRHRSGRQLKRHLALAVEPAQHVSATTRKPLTLSTPTPEWVSSIHGKEDRSYFHDSPAPNSSTAHPSPRSPIAIAANL